MPLNLKACLILVSQIRIFTCIELGVDQSFEFKKLINLDGQVDFSFSTNAQELSMLLVRNLEM